MAATKSKSASSTGKSTSSNSPSNKAGSSKSGSRARGKSGTSRSTRRASQAARKPADAIALLKADHKEVKGWFDEFEKTDDDTAKAELARRICVALTVHAQIEEEIFYPAGRDALDDDQGDDLLDEAEVEHASAKQLIAEISVMQVGDPLLDAKVKVLGEYVQHHVDEEEGELFPEYRDAGVDLKALGEQLAARREELTAEMA